MKRSLSAALAIIATVCGATAARADLDSLLGDWAEAASHESDAYAAEDFTLAPASAGIGGPETAQPQTPARVQATASANKAADKTLTSHAGSGIYQDHAGAIPGVVEAPVMEGYAAPTATINPYYTPASADCGCDSGDCKKTSSCGCGGGCGELIDGGQGCYCKGLSECRPHQRPVLPPPSSLLQIFRSRNSYSSVWAGYAEETRARCRNTSPHLLGTWRTCDHGGLLEPACNTCNSCESGESCDSGCDR
ncbi:hypothetical protein [Rhodopirellula sp. SWK7]|uniref:hypothetical protein n=1 Tax=Rhodopirellula sp. SWK7 TaxID=595460 RepID=UPI0002BF1086|nr:hypothetical protein [Rhodopirellula sp. SWK7]EMI41397.1 signal peptide protein [Rhodopirellula sp. SWK7]